ncbi:hypothetical protein BpHYR1_032942 [Brachionus plicatilis]|uniref:Uncharacterized protein n=1 Tax=Brachionus plicatilis TaxID=10195 RepID=A0A3M7RPW2_BRAPC|nr:hypothetical protein BpHYR1_032942 [Brachionus plicatilis]
MTKLQLMYHELAKKVAFEELILEQKPTKLSSLFASNTFCTINNTKNTNYNYKYPILYQINELNKRLSFFESMIESESNRKEFCHVIYISKKYKLCKNLNNIVKWYWINKLKKLLSNLSIRI